LSSTAQTCIIVAGCIMCVYRQQEVNGNQAAIKRLLDVGEVMVRYNYNNEYYR